MGGRDILHSYGKKKDITREDAILSLRELIINNLRVEVWIDQDNTLETWETT